MRRCKSGFNSVCSNQAAILGLAQGLYAEIRLGETDLAEEFM